MVNSAIKTRKINADPTFADELDDIKMSRKDKKEKSYRRLTLAIRRHPLWKDIKKDIIKDELKD